MEILLSVITLAVCLLLGALSIVENRSKAPQPKRPRKRELIMPLNSLRCHAFKQMRSDGYFTWSNAHICLGEEIQPNFNYKIHFVDEKDQEVYEYLVMPHKEVELQPGVYDCWVASVVDHREIRRYINKE